MRSPDSKRPAVGERELIERIRRRLPPAPASLLVGPGDDAAVVVPERGTFQVLTTDAVVEGIHFDLDFSSLADVGYKSLAVNLSDLAAMGAAPEFALLSFIIPERISAGDVDLLLDGLLEIAATARIAIAGGNISGSPGPLVIDVTAIGSVRPRRILTRAGARPGDALFTTGSIGAAAAGLDWLTLRRTAAGRDSQSPGEPSLDHCVQRHRRPEPRLRIGMLLGRNRAASACIDLSDGLGAAVRQLAEASGVGAEIDVAALPIDRAATEWFAARGQDPVTAAVAGGDDFELLFAVPQKRRGRLRAVVAGARGVPITRIGEITRGPDVVLVRGEAREPLPPGFVHF